MVLDHKPITITKRGTTVAKVVPISNVEKEEFFDCLQSKAKITSDIINPIEESWDAEK